MTGDILQSTLRVEGIRSNRLHRHYKLRKRQLPLWCEKNFKPRPQNRILVTLRGFFQNFRRVFRTFNMGVPSEVLLSLFEIIKTILIWQFFVFFQAHLKSLFISHLCLATKQCVIFVIMHSGVTTVTRRVQTCADEETLWPSSMYESQNITYSPRHCAMCAASVPSIGSHKRETTGWTWLAR